MSEGDVSLIRDEDVLRRMWQQTEDFSRKKEIRAHMYRLREERLRNLYSPEPATADIKGCEFTSPQGHVKSFADQTFQSMKSKEVRDAASPPKEFTYRGQDLKELSNAGWNVESQDQRTDDGRTHVKSVHANIEGHYDVEGGRGQFVAEDRQRRAITEYSDENSSVRRDESATSTAARDHVVRRTDDGTHFSSSTSSSNTSSKIQQVSSTKFEKVPYTTDDDHNDHSTSNTNRNEKVTSITRNDYERNEKRNQFNNAELLSRKVEYPDDNTKVIVETRSLPDGTRVTSTRREFRAPVQSTHLESYQSKSESKSYSSHHKSDSRETSSNRTSHTVDNRTNDIVDSQRNVDDFDFKRQLREYTSRDDDANSGSHKGTDHRGDTIYDRKVSDFTQTDDTKSHIQKEYKVSKKVIDQSLTNEDDQYTQTNLITSMRNEVSKDETDRHKLITTRDDLSTQHKEHIEINKDKNTDHRIHKFTKDTTKTEEAVERKISSDHYQTTYQTDFQQNKITNDWSPTHQAWASTLRSETPTPTHPSTRASSPGSRTFKSSTSSLRSSVSPEKTSRKSSRGGSPNKVDRLSPTRTINSDRYSNTTQSITEIRKNKNTSPERKPPTGRSDSRSAYSPERKHQDEYRPRPSTSPEKRQPSPSSKATTSPERKQPTEYFRKGSPTRPHSSHKEIVGSRQSPEIKSNFSFETPGSNAIPRSTLKSSTSPDKNPTEATISQVSPRSSPSLDRKPSYQKPEETISSSYPRNTSPSPSFKPPDNLSQKPELPSNKQPDFPEDNPNRPLTNRTSASPDRKPGYMKPIASQQSPDTKKISSSDRDRESRSKSPTKKSLQSPERQHQNYKGNKQIQHDHYKFVDEESKNYTHNITSVTDKKVKIINNRPEDRVSTDSQEVQNILCNENNFESDDFYGRNDTLVETTNITKQNILIEDTNTSKTTPKEKSSVAKGTPSRENSPSKFDTYEKKTPHVVNKTNEIIVPSEISNFEDTLKHNDKLSTPKIRDNTSAPINKIPKDSASPVKSPIENSKLRITTDFIKTETSTEEQNVKKTKKHSRQLITPSSSPTRKPKPDQTEPSTGQSSPTTSVSGFVYFSSSRTDSNLITDLDEYYPDNEEPREFTTKRPETLDMNNPASPSKVSCRSPSPEKKATPIKERLPRKSSLKKPVTDVNYSTPSEKPPTTFHISPTDEKSNIGTHNIVKKDRAETEKDDKLGSSVKPKPPLQRRETYEDRCRKILGMVNDNSTETVPIIKTLESNQNSPTVSPCDSPGLKESSPILKNPTYEETTASEIDNNIFLSLEKEDFTKTMLSHDIKKNKAPSRESSPKKLKDITSNTTLETESGVNSKDVGYDITPNTPEPCYHRPEQGGTKRISKSPEKIPLYPSNSFHSNISPDRKSSSYRQPSPTKEILNEPKLSSSKIITEKIACTTSVTSDRETSKNAEDTVSKISSQKTHPSKVLESPIRELSHQSDSPRNISPCRPQTMKAYSPTEKSVSPNRETLINNELVQKSNNHVIPDKIPGYMKNTATSKKRDTTLTSETVKEDNTSKTHLFKSGHTSLPQNNSRSTSPVKSPQSFTSNRPDVAPERPPDHPDKLQDVPDHMKTTKSTAKYETTSMSHDIEDTTNSKIIEKKFSLILPDSPTHQTHTQSKSVLSKMGHSTDKKPNISNQPISPSKENPSKGIEDKYQTSREKIPGYMKPTSTSTHNTKVYEVRKTEDIKDTLTEQNNCSITTRTISPTRRISKSSNTKNKSNQDTGLPTNQLASTVNQSSQRTVTSPDRKFRQPSPIKDSTIQDINKTQKFDASRSKSVSPNRPCVTSVISEHDSELTTTKNTHSILESDEKHHHKSSKSPPTRFSKERVDKEDDNPQQKSNEPRQLRTPSPTKKIINVTEISSDFLVSEKEHEILDRVQKSLKKLSSEQKQKSPSRDANPFKVTTNLLDLDISVTETCETEKNKIQHNITEIDHAHSKSNEEKGTGRTNITKHLSTNIPTTKTSHLSPKMDKISDSPKKSRSVSPKKSIQTDRPRSPQVPKSSGIKQRENIPAHLTRKPTPATLSTIKVERLTTDVNRSNGAIKQNISTKTTTTKSTRQIPSPTSPKRAKENVGTKKDTVTRSTSDTNMKPKKISPQSMKSKPEIQVSDMSPKSSKIHKPFIKEPHSKFPSKPKSATALNTSTDEDDIIIDVQQSKSSRENSPDRICPTPINFSDDVSTPRFPDEVSEPDDDFQRRSYHTIHETESVVDDIVEICEDEELFVRKSEFDKNLDDSDNVLTVNDKLNKFANKIQATQKPKDTILFADTEKRVHSDFIDSNLKSDECLLSVSEKVTKFAKGPRNTKDTRSLSRKITDEYDTDTVYQDDYTKLSVNDKAHLFVETAENSKITKLKPALKVERPDLSNVDESLKSDDCLLSVSDKVSKFVKSSENVLTENQVIDETEYKINEQHKKVMRQIIHDEDDGLNNEINLEDRDDTLTFDTAKKTSSDHPANKIQSKNKESRVSQPNEKHYNSPISKTVERTPTIKITTLRSSEAVKKAKALFENIASTQKTNEVHIKTTKLTDIGVIKKSAKTNSTTVLHPSVEDVSQQVVDANKESDVETSKETSKVCDATISKPHHPQVDEKIVSSPNRMLAQPLEVRKSKSPMRHSGDTRNNKTEYNKTVLAGNSAATQRFESTTQRPENDKQDKSPGYLRPTKTSQSKEEPKTVEETEASNRRGSGKFGVELRRTSVERSTISSERRRSVEHHQPCIEDIFDLDLLEQMLEKVVGYEQRRRIRAQIRIAKNQNDHNMVDNNSTTINNKNITNIPKTRSPEIRQTKSPEKVTQKTSSPERQGKSPLRKTLADHDHPKVSIINGHAKEPAKISTVSRRPHSPEKFSPKTTLSSKGPIRQSSPDKKRTMSPSKTTSKPKSNRFNEYASAYLKKVGLSDADKLKLSEIKTKKSSETKQTVKHEKHETVQQFSTTKSFTDRTSSKDVIEIVEINGKRSSSPEKISERKVQSPERQAQSPDRKVQSPDRKAQSPTRKALSSDRIYQRSPSPDFKRPKTDSGKETVFKTVHDIEKRIPTKQVQEEKPSWVTNRNLKKITSESRTFSSRKVETEKPKYRAPSPSKTISKPIDVITSSYGPGPLDSDGKPLFGIKALRNGASNFQVKGTVIRQEFHSRNGGEPQGTVSVTAYSSQPEELEQLLASQGVEAPSKIHGLSAITTTKKFGGDTGNTLSNIQTKEERTSLEHFTHTDRKVDSRIHNMETSYDTTIEEIADTRRTESLRSEKQTDRIDRSSKNDEKKTEGRRGHQVEERRERQERREDKKTVRQSSVKSLTEKYIKSANDSGKVDRSTYPKAGLILRTTTMRDSVSSDDAHPGLVRTDSEHSLGSMEDTVVTTTTERSGDGVRTTTTRTTHHHGPTVTTHTKGSTVITHHEPVITKKTSTIITQEPIITRRVITHDPQKVHQGSTVTTERSFLDSNTKVTGVQDILTRMKNADIVIQEGDTSEDVEARALLNKFLGATVLMAGMQGYVTEQPAGKVVVKESVRSSSGGGKQSSRSVDEIDLDQCWDERLLRKLLDECTDYDQRRLLRARLRTLMAEQEACASAVNAALGAAGAEGAEGGESGETREEEEVTVTSSVRRDSSEKTVSSSSTTTKTSKVIEMTRPAPKPVSPFAKFRQLEKQNSTNSPNSPKTPQSPGSPSQPYFKFTDPALHTSALTIKERLLQWCRDKTRDYENVKLENFSTSWADGLAFCALLHHFLPDAFDYSELTPDKRRHNFTLAFKIADEKAGIYPLLDVEDMVSMRRPDWKCVFTYVQAIYRRFKDQH